MSDDIKFVIAAGLGILVVAVALGVRKLFFTADGALNPTNSNNIVNRQVTGLVSAAVGREETLGGMLAEYFDSNTRKVADMLKKPTSCACITAPCDCGGIVDTADYLYVAPASDVAPYFAP